MLQPNNAQTPMNLAQQAPCFSPDFETHWPASQPFIATMNIRGTYILFEAKPRAAFAALTLSQPGTADG